MSCQIKEDNGPRAVGLPRNLAQNLPRCCLRSKNIVVLGLVGKPDVAFDHLVVKASASLELAACAPLRRRLTGRPSAWRSVGLLARPPREVPSRHAFSPLFGGRMLLHTDAGGCESLARPAPFAIARSDCSRWPADDTRHNLGQGRVYSEAPDMPFKPFDRPDGQPNAACWARAAK